MAKNNNSHKGWGGPFDFNGDGKTTWDEEAFGLMLMEQCRKNSTASSSSYKSRERKPLPTIKPVPEVVDENNYSNLLTDYRGECISAIIAMVLFLAPAVLILWAVYSTYDPDNSASGFLTILFTIAGLIYGGVVLATAGKSIGASLENIELVKKRYSGPAIQKPKRTKWWIWPIIPLAIISIVFVTSKDPTEVADTDTGCAPSYHSYTPSSKPSYSFQGVSKKINTTPAMTKEEADRLRGTGYHGTRPNSTAESMELKAAQVKCKTCGMHSDNGLNSQCDACAYNKKHGLD